MTDSADSGATSHAAHARLLQDLDNPTQVFANLGPNWFASVMGTGIVAVSAAVLPVQIRGQHVFAVIVWIIASIMLIALCVGTVIHWVKFRATARKWVTHPIIAQFYGAPPMAFMTVGLATLLVGKSVIGEQAALTIDWVLWSLGTVGGIASAIVIPYFMFTRDGLDQGSAFGGWLMPVVPPMVSAATGAALVPHAPSGQWTLTMVVFCYALFGLSLIASLIIISLLWSRMLFHAIPAAVLIPTLWIVLGPLGQSITAANNLGGAAAVDLPGPYETIMEAFGLMYGVPVWGFALLWAAIAGLITIKVARERLPFSLTWWSFTFPVGTMVTGTSALAIRSGSVMLEWASVALFIALLLAWGIVAIRTAKGAYRGRLFLPAPAPSTPPSLA